MTAPLCSRCGRPRATTADWDHAQGCVCERCRAVCWSPVHCSTRERLVEIIDEAFGPQPPAYSTGELLASLERLLRERGESLREALAERDRLREQVRRAEVVCVRCSRWYADAHMRAAANAVLGAVREVLSTPPSRSDDVNDDIADGMRRAERGAK